MPQVYFSYSGQDRDLAEKLAGRLRKAAPELDVVLDTAIDEEATSIPSGAYCLPYVGRRLRSASAVVTVLTKSYANSDACWFEASAALAMEKVVPVNVDPALSPANLNALVGQTSVPTFSAVWLGKDDPEDASHEKGVFKRFARNVGAMCGKRRPFSDWAPAEPRHARELATDLARQLRSGLIRRPRLAWPPGRVGHVQKRRFFLAIGSMSTALGDGAWDVARRKVLRALTDEPLEVRARAEALMGLVGELMSPSDGAAPVEAREPWEFVGDLSLPIDRDISRFAYIKAGNVPNDIRDVFHVLKPRAEPRRTAALALGAVGGGIAGLAIGYYLGQATGGDAAPDRQSPATSDREAPQVEPPPSQPPPQPPPAPSPPPQPPIASAPPLPSPPHVLTVTARGLEVSVKDEVERLGLPEDSWPEVYSQVVSLNINTLCTPAKWERAAAAGKKPLDIITKEDTILWPTQTNLETARPLLECPAPKRYMITTAPN